MKESISLFRKAVNDSADLQEKCNSIQARAGTEQEGLKDLVEPGKENGHEFSAEELKEAYEQLQEDEVGELTEFEMAAVAGGRDHHTNQRLKRERGKAGMGGKGVSGCH